MSKSKDNIKTYTGIYFNPLEIKVENIEFRDIAHSLSLQCRGGGHIKHFFSVAQHSINCSLEAKARGFSKKVQLACLLHDASEAYISDITRPVKRQLEQYMEIEKLIQDQVWDTLFEEPLNNEELYQVFEIDEVMLYYELEYLLEEIISDEVPRLEIQLELEFVDFPVVENNFMRIFEELKCLGN